MTLAPRIGSLDETARALGEVAAETGSDRPDVCGQRLVEVEAWERAYDLAPDVLDGELAPREYAERLAGGLRALIAAVNDVSRRPSSALWRGCRDRAAQALIFAAEERGNQAQGEIAAREALAAPGPLRGELRMADLDLGHGPERVQLRASCCLWYRVPGEPKCSVCPLVPDRERAERLRGERDGP